MSIPTRLRDLIAVGLAVALVALFALWRMGYLDRETANHVRLTDNSRTAYVAKNLVDGHGYTTNDLPAALLDFYDREGRLDDARWENADRFPFTAYAIAGLYTVTGSTSYAVGITLYNFLTFVGYLLVVFALTRTVWNDRAAALVAVALALAHPYSFRFLYLKDADSQLLAAGLFLALHHFLVRPAHLSSTKMKVTLGTLLGWSFLARPNVGAAFVLVLAFLGVRQALRDRKADGLAFAGRRLLRGYGLVAAVMIAWCLPFAIDSMREWGTPFFSANNIYQLPLGTRYGMGTDTWWKYTEPGHSISLREMWRLAPDDMRAKLTTSWLATAKATFQMYGVELLLTLIVLGWLRRRPPTDDTATPDVTPGATFRMLLGTAGFAIVFNLATLPLYAYQNFSFVHYLAFALPVVWAAAGFAIMATLRQAAQAWPAIVDSVTRHRRFWALGVAAAILLWSLGSKGGMMNAWFVEPSRWAARHWLLSLFVLGVAIGAGWIWRPMTFTRGVLLITVLALARYKVDRELLIGQAVFFPLNDHVAPTLRERTGLVSSFALQNEVAWMSGRKNIPAPDYALHLYSYRFDHRLDVEDIYLESAEAMIQSGLGPFSKAAPGFETYARMQRYGGTFPGYQRVFHEAGTTSYGARSTPLPKASTVYRLVDPAAVARVAETPTRLDLGSIDNIVHTAYGFGGYVEVDGHAAVVTTDAIARRYVGSPEIPSEDVGITYFIGDRVPRAIELEIYATGPGTVAVYANVDRFAYTRRRDVPQHLLGVVELTGAGWQTVHLALPPGSTPHGFNKLGLVPSTYYPTILCPAAVSDGECLRTPLEPLPKGTPDPAAPRVVRTTGAGPATAVRSALLLGALTFVE